VADPICVVCKEPITCNGLEMEDGLICHYCAMKRVERNNTSYFKFLKEQKAKERKTNE